MSNNDLAHKIFNALFDDDDLNEMYSAGFIAQPLGYQISSVATIEVELDNNHDRMVEEIAELKCLLVDINEWFKDEFIFGGDGNSDIEQLLAKLNQEGGGDNE